MAAVEALSAPPAVSAYCRQARRVRGRLAGQPGRMHRELRGLTLRQEALDRTGLPVAARSRVREFADEVAGSLEGPVLRYAKRRRLISRARSLGIGDFEANLIIAAAQHERRREGFHQVSAQPVAPAPRRPWLAQTLVFIAVESLIALGAWAVFLH